MKIVCAKHNRWTKIVNADGKIAERPCPECPWDGSPDTTRELLKPQPPNYPNRAAKLYDMLLLANREYQRDRTPTIRGLIARLGYFHGMLEAYCVISGEDAETVIKEIRDDEIAASEMTGDDTL